jgi:hypothetical protein
MHNVKMPSPGPTMSLWRRPLPLWWRALPFVLALPLALACESDNLKPEPVEEDDRLYWSLELNHRAVTLGLPGSGYDTLTLVAIPRNFRGEPLAGFSAPTYVSKSTDLVTVTDDGQLHALSASTTPAWVVATVTAGNVKHSDSVQIRVMDPPIGLASFSVHPVAPDSAKEAVNTDLLAISPKLLQVHATDANGALVTGLPVSFHSSDPTVASIDRVTGGITGLRTGPVTFYASTTAFGVAKADTVPYQIGRPLYYDIIINYFTPADGAAPYFFFEPSEITVGTGALIRMGINFPGTIINTVKNIDIVFTGDNQSNVLPSDASVLRNRSTMFIFCTGNPFFGIPPTATNCAVGGNIEGSGTIGGSERPVSLMSYRVFSAPGVYEFHSTRLGGISGRIIVVDDEAP